MLHVDAALTGDHGPSTASPYSLHEPILNPMQTSFETDLAAWLTWLEVAQRQFGEARSLTPVGIGVRRWLDSC